jgi:hypothetical protein
LGNGGKKMELGWADPSESLVVHSQMFHWCRI